MGADLNHYDRQFAEFGRHDAPWTRKGRKALFEQLLPVIPQRVDYLIEFLRGQGLDVAATAAGLRVVDQWITQAELPCLPPLGSGVNKFVSGPLPDGWAAFCVDLGLAIGQVDCAGVPTARWELYLGKAGPPGGSSTVIGGSPVVSNIPGLQRSDPWIAYVATSAWSVTRLAWSRSGSIFRAVDLPVASLLGSCQRAVENIGAYVDESSLLTEAEAETIARGGRPVGVKESVRRKYAKHLRHGDIGSTGDISVFAPMPEESVHALVAAGGSTKAGPEPLPTIAAFADALLAAWPEKTGHAKLDSPYESDPRADAGVEQLTFELYGTDALIDAMLEDVERLAAAHGLPLYYGSSGRLIMPT